MTDADEAERFRVPPSDCPKCGKVLEVAFIPGEDEAVRPMKGNYTVCRFCVAVLMFTVDGGGGLRLVTRREIAALSKAQRRELEVVVAGTRHAHKVLANRN